MGKITKGILIVIGIIFLILIVGAFKGSKDHKKAVEQYSSGQVDSSGTPLVVAFERSSMSWFWPFYWGYWMGGGMSRDYYAPTTVINRNYYDTRSVSDSGTWGEETRPSSSWSSSDDDGSWGSSWDSSDDSGSWGSSWDSSSDSGSWGDSSYDSGSSWGDSSSGSWGE